jgi:YhcH/YjgK/YiaL family protein
MIIDTIKNAHKYFGIHSFFEKAFEHINQFNLNDTQPGKYDIAEGLKAIYSIAPGKSKEASLSKFECHNLHIDIQLCVKGIETIGWKPREKCTQANGEYNVDKDVQFFNDSPDMFFQLTDGQFAIFFPEDVHAPMIGEGDINKLVIKVKV